MLQNARMFHKLQQLRQTNQAGNCFLSVSEIKISFIQLKSLNSRRVQYGNPVLHSITYLCIDIDQ